MESSFWNSLPSPRGLDPLYFRRRASIESALNTTGTTNPRFVIDVGANIGETVNEFLVWFPNCSVVAFEPLPEAFAELQARFSSSEWSHRTIISRQLALSDICGQRTLYSSSSQNTTSSFAEFNRKASTVHSHRGLRASKSSLELDDRDISKVDVQVTTLDDHFSNPSNPESRLVSSKNFVDVLKIDTQGWDLKVLQGGQKLLQNTKVVLLNWIFDDIYGPPTPIFQLDQLLSGLGFRLWDISHIYKDLYNLRTLWVDLVYVSGSFDKPRD